MTPYKDVETFGPYNSSDTDVHLVFNTQEMLHANRIYSCFIVASNIAGNTTSLPMVVCKKTSL